jgi:hypothetical protein
MCWKRVFGPNYNIKYLWAEKTIGSFMRTERTKFKKNVEKSVLAEGQTLFRVLDFL